MYQKINKLVMDDINGFNSTSTADRLYTILEGNNVDTSDSDKIRSIETGNDLFGENDVDLLSKQLGIPLVHTYHTMYEDYVHYITHGYFNRSSKKIVEYLTLFYCDKTISELVVPTKKAYELFKQKYKVDRNVYIVPTGIDVEKFYREKNPKLDVLKKRKELGICKDDFVILFVGRIGTEKNIDLLLSCYILYILD